MGRTPNGGDRDSVVPSALIYLRTLLAGVPLRFTPACVLVHFQRTAGQIIEHQHLQCEISGLKILLLNAVELHIRQNKGTSNITHGDCAKHTTSSFLIPTSYVKNTSSFKTSPSPSATTSTFVIPTSNIRIYYYENFQRHENLEDYYPVYYHRTHSHHQLVLCAELQDWLLTAVCHENNQSHCRSL